MKGNGATSNTRIQLAILVVLTLQNASVPLMMRYARTSESVPYCVPLLVVIQEVIKLVASIFLLAREVGLGSLLSTIQTEIIGRWDMTLRLAVPACLFFLQNNCMQLANTYLPAAVFQVTYQGKTFIVALLSVLMLGSRLERFKWLGIAGLAAGVSLVNVSNSSDTKSREGGAAELIQGLFYVITAACCSGFANVYFEKMVKTAETVNTDGTEAKKPSLWVRNIQLATFTILLGLPVIRFAPTFDIDDPFRGFNPMVIGLAFNNSLGGLLVALIIKYGDNILKGFSNAISTVLATVVSIPLFGFKTGIHFAVGVVLVIWSTMVYGRMIQFKSEWWNVVMFAPPSPSPKNGVGLQTVKVSN
eukprot:CAMPEP_0167794994 /NCGR_PEP_ID=MMETSP0111_2-20121227/14170_1 /TAXON_ID=91324 /ORGANISM="Lotharella globosa, Strain CCCM811" /LENGTH=359 /DNA_ID=CAMNT_0007688575 /DNA_START=60 /DNA_END=1139 /DNA_ORIENTATION=-